MANIEKIEASKRLRVVLAEQDKTNRWLDEQFGKTEHTISRWCHNKSQLEEMNLNQYATGVAQPGLSLQRIFQLSVGIPPLAEQKQIVSEIGKLEAQINESRSFKDSCPAKKQAILDNYLK